MMSVQHDIDDFVEMFKQVTSNLPHHRVIAITFTAYIEEYLKKAIQTRMPGLTHKKDDETKNKIFGASGILNTYAANVEAAHALLLIDSALKQELITIARIRNRFAHNLRINNFENEELDKLLRSLNGHKSFNVAYFDHLPEKTKIFSISALRACMMLNNILVVQSELIQKVDMLIQSDKQSHQGDTTALLKVFRNMLATVSVKS